MPFSAFTNREGGFSKPPYSSFNLGTHVGDDSDDVARNRARAQELFGPIVWMNQTHSDQVVRVDSAGVVDGDAIVTQTPGIALAVQVADCIPLLLATESTVAAVHVGRRGLLNQIALKALAMMSGESVRALLGPSICGRCYEVGVDIYDEVVAQHPLAAATTQSGKKSLDLARALTQVLEREGVEVVHEQRCTVETLELFSYRRDGRTGRQIGVISL